MAEQEAAAKAEAERLLAEKNGPLFEDLSRLDKLAQNDDFRWFMDKYLAPMEKKELGLALDINRSKDERDNSCHRWNLAKATLDLLETERTQLANKLYPKK